MNLQGMKLIYFIICELSMEMQMVFCAIISFHVRKTNIFF